MKEPTIMYRGHITSWQPEASLDDWIDLMKSCVKRIEELSKDASSTLGVK